MGLLIVAILFAIGFTLLSLQNTLTVPLYAGDFVFYIPVFLLVFGTLLLGLFVAWFLSAIGWVSSSMAIRKRDSVINNANRTIDHLQTRVRELEFESKKLRGEKDIVQEEVAEPERKGFFERFRTHPSIS